MFGASLSLLLLPIFGTTIQFTVCHIPTAPTFTTQNATTTASTSVIAGTTSPTTAVTIADNNQPVANLNSDSSGDFSLEVSLASGTNSFTATATNPCGSATSTTPLLLTKVAAPSNPSTAKTTAPLTVINKITARLATTEFTSTPAPTTASNTVINGILSLQLQVPSDAYTKTGSSTTKASVFLRGTTLPGAQVTILDNGRLVARLTAAADGTFGVSVPLIFGRNSITVQASLHGQTTTQTITYNRTVPAHHTLSHWWWLIGGSIVLLIIIMGGSIVRWRRRRVVVS
jgi:hypothetical protein